MRYSITWQDGNFDSSATVLSFYTKAARDNYPMQCAQRVRTISSSEKTRFEREGRKVWLMLWDKSEPTKYTAQG